MGAPSYTFHVKRWALALAILGGCGPDAVEVHDYATKAACGTCVFHIPRSRGCFWAVQYGDEFLPASGPAVPPVDMVEAHSPGGMCTMPRDVVVDGTVTAGRFVATRFELGPAPDVPADLAAPPHAH